MAIGSVIERPNNLIVYDECGRQLTLIPLYMQNARLQGYTAHIVSVRQGNIVVTYDERGRQMTMIPCGT